MVNFDSFRDYTGLGSWDEVVECDWGDPTPEQSRMICELGYYGLPIEARHIDSLNRGEAVVRKAFTFRGLGDDGFPWSEEFDDREVCLEYARQYPGMKLGVNYWVDDDGRCFEVGGVTYDEIF